MHMHIQLTCTQADTHMYARMHTHSLLTGYHMLIDAFNIYCQIPQCADYDRDNPDCKQNIIVRKLSSADAVWNNLLYRKLQ